MAESKIVPNWNISVSFFGQEIKEEVDKYSESGYYSSTITDLKNIFSTTKMNSEKPPAGGGARD